MYTWSGAHCASAIKEFYKNNGSVEAAYTELLHHLNLKHHDCVPSANTVNTWIHNFEEIGVAMKRKL